MAEVPGHASVSEPDAEAHLSLVDHVEIAARYWRLSCLLAATHTLGLSWPPPGRPRRSRLVGHWGCNGGLAWITGHLAAHWAGGESLILVTGTGHATSFVLAHQLISREASKAEVREVTARYGQRGGDPSEIIGEPGVPFVGGELGAALGVSQGLAASLPNRAVACLIGDGECETPAALAALAHAGVLLDGEGASSWVPVVNANGARMGGHSRFDAGQLERLLRGFGYEVHVSGPYGHEASEAAARALDDSAKGTRTAWVSVSEKGWPAPAAVGTRRFRGHLAHKAASLLPFEPEAVEELAAWSAELAGEDLIDADGNISPDLVALARRGTFEIDVSTRRDAVREAWPSPQPTGEEVTWSSPAGAVDVTLARRGARVFCPDEAVSNRLERCLANGQVKEVLAEELCAAWTWGTVEAGREAVFSTYEAFAPLVSTLLAQYAKMTHTRPPAGRPPLAVMVTSLGWANSPTHQNTDLVATVLARPWPRLRLLCPLGARSASARADEALAGDHDGISVVVHSKQSLLDLPDPGMPAVLIGLPGADTPTATIVAVGDVCVTEAVAAMLIAAASGVSMQVLAVVDVRAAGRLSAAVAACVGPSERVVGVSWCAPEFVSPLLWSMLGRRFPVHGYQEKWGPTAYETLRRNGQDRASLLAAATGLYPPVEGLEEDGPGVPSFSCPPLTAVGLGA